VRVCAAGQAAASTSRRWPVAVKRKHLRQFKPVALAAIGVGLTSARVAAGSGLGNTVAPVEAHHGMGAPALNHRVH
jgi:hypothetical protein